MAHIIFIIKISHITELKSRFGSWFRIHDSTFQIYQHHTYKQKDKSKNVQSTKCSSKLTACIVCKFIIFPNFVEKNFTVDICTEFCTEQKRARHFAM